jgi:hypothetical protein
MRLFVRKAVAARLIVSTGVASIVCRCTNGLLVFRRRRCSVAAPMKPEAGHARLKVRRNSADSCVDNEPMP